MARPSEKNPNGEQKKYKQTPEVLASLKFAFSIGATDAEACIHAGIAKSTYYEWRVDSLELSDEFDRLKNAPILTAKKTIVDGLDDVKNAQWYLERKCKDEFSAKIENNHTNSDGSMKPPPTRIELVAPSVNKEA